MAENRATDTRRDKDKIGNFKITIYDVDNAILSYMTDIIAPTVQQQGSKLKVPIIWSNPERWAAVRKDGVLRDERGRIQLPLIMIRQNSIARHDNLTLFNRELQYTTAKSWSKKNSYDKFSVQQGIRPTIESYNITMPDYVNIFYEVTAWTDKISHMNEIIEKINFNSDEYWGTDERFKFKVRINDYNHDQSVGDSSTRIIKSTFQLETIAYLLPESDNNIITTERTLSPKQLVFSEQIISTAQNSTEPVTQSISLNPPRIERPASETVTVVTPIPSTWDEKVAEYGQAYAYPISNNDGVSHFNGDEVWIESNIFAASRSLATGKMVNFLVDSETLVENNAFGNKNRFTDSLGGQDYGGYRGNRESNAIPGVVPKSGWTRFKATMREGDLWWFEANFNTINGQDSVTIDGRRCGKRYTDSTSNTSHYLLKQNIFDDAIYDISLWVYIPTNTDIDGLIISTDFSWEGASGYIDRRSVSAPIPLNQWHEITGSISASVLDDDLWIITTSGSEVNFVATNDVNDNIVYFDSLDLQRQNTSSLGDYAYVVDNYTGLGWYAQSVSQVNQFSQSLGEAAYEASQSFNGYDDWFIPTVSQWRTIIRPSGSGAATGGRNVNNLIKGAFVDNSDYAYSSTVMDSDERYAINYEGTVFAATAYNAYVVLCRKHF